MSRFSRPLSFFAFNDAVFGGSGHNSCQLEAGSLEQGPEFVLGSLLAAGDQQHDQIEELAVVRLVAGRNDTLDDEQFARRQHCSVAVAQYCPALFVVPILHDVPQDVGIGSLGYGVEGLIFVAAARHECGLGRASMGGAAEGSVILQSAKLMGGLNPEKPQIRLFGTLGMSSRLAGITDE